MDEEELRYIGYHGTKLENAEKIISEKKFIPSKSVMSLREALEAEENGNTHGKAYQWLGDGIYFWNNDLERALKWNKSDCAIRTPICVKNTKIADLSTTKIRKMFDFLINTIHIVGNNQVYKMTNYQRKYIIGYCCDYLQEYTHNNYDVYMCGFPDKAADELSLIYTQQIQICVKNDDCINYDKLKIESGD